MPLAEEPGGGQGSVESTRGSGNSARDRGRQGSRAALTSRFVHALALFALSGLSACSGGGSGLTTGALFGEEKKPVTDERTERAMQAGATSARATKCGYNFDPAKLRQAYLNYEAAQGGTPDERAKAEKVFDFTRNSLTTKLAKEEGFCDEAKTKEIKAVLTRQLAGDFSGPPRKVEVAVPSGWWANPENVKPMDRDAVFDPVLRKGSTY